jgi:hypothetical protein
MNFTTITISGNKLDSFQRDYVVKIGFGVFGANYTKSVKSCDLHIIIGQLSNKNIPFTFTTSTPTYVSRPCTTCKH